MKRVLRAIAIAVTLLLSTAIVSFCYSSIHGRRFIHSEHILLNREFNFTALNGQFSAGCSTGLPLPRERRISMHATGASGWTLDWELDQYLAVRAGWQDFMIRDVRYRERFYGVSIPARLTAALGSALIALILVRIAALPLLRLIRARWRKFHNACPTCSYDLTGNTSGVCPECGSAI